MLKTIHVLLATFLFGTQMLYYVLLCMADRQPHASHPSEILTQNIRINIVLVALLIGAALSGTALVTPYGWTFQTPWIRGAYILILFYVILWLISIRLTYARQTLSIGLHTCYVLMLFILMMIIKDAVTKQTWL